MDASARSSASCSRLGPCHGGTAAGMGLRRPPQPLTWLQVAEVIAADGDHQDLVAGGSAATAKAGKRRRRSPAKRGVARGLKVLVSGVVEMVGRRFERSIPAVRFGHVAYVR
ncbi:hypothetical protein ACP70R_004727 [Stipagrostis hirtigluma subsp. patula]